MVIPFFLLLLATMVITALALGWLAIEMCEAVGRHGPARRFSLATTRPVIWAMERGRTLGKRCVAWLTALRNGGRLAWGGAVSLLDAWLNPLAWESSFTSRLDRMGKAPVTAPRVLKRADQFALRAAPLPKVQSPTLPAWFKSRVSSLSVAPNKAVGQWKTGFASDRGQVRSQNEDAGMVLEIGPFQVVIVADGMGGVPYGSLAAQAAASAAAAFLEQRLARAKRGATAPIRNLAREAILQAAQSVTAVSQRERVPAEQMGTTLIVLIAWAEKIAYAAIGDGAIWCLRAQSAGNCCRQLWTPVKVFQNELSDFLAGDGIHGQLADGEDVREAGDVLLAATDGVADYVESEFLARTCLGQTVRRGGDLSLALSDVLAAFAAHRVQGLHLFTDNMTCAAIANGRPRIPEGFWKHEKPAPDQGDYSTATPTLTQ